MTPQAPASAHAISVGTLLDIPDRDLPAELLNPPAPAVVIETHGGRGGAAYIAAVALEWTPFLTLRWDGERFPDVAAWPDLLDARLAADSLRDLLDQKARGRVPLPRVSCRVVDADETRWRVVGPSWGGRVEEVRPGRVAAFTDHCPDPIGYSASLRAGVRRLARFHRMPDARLV